MNAIAVLLVVGVGVLLWLAKAPWWGYAAVLVAWYVGVRADEHGREWGEQDRVRRR